MNWFILYYEILTKTGIFGIILFLITIIGIISLCLPFLMNNEKWVNKSIIKTIPSIIFICIGTIILIIIFSHIIDKLIIETSIQFKSSFEVGYFFIGMMPFLISPTITLKYCKWFNKDYNKVVK